MTGNILLLPPVAFTIVLTAGILAMYLFSRLSFRPKKEADGLRKPYACGEEFSDYMIQPDYSTFFPFAFFFTILHVVVLVIATMPMEMKTSRMFVIALAFLTGAFISLSILLRKEDY